MVQFTDKEVAKVEVQVSITENDIENIIVTSFERESRYWVKVDTTTEEWKNKPNNEPISEWATKLILEGKTIRLLDITEEGLLEDGEAWNLTLPKLIEGIKSDSGNIVCYPDKGAWGLSDADRIIQYAILGKILYE